MAVYRLTILSCAAVFVFCGAANGQVDGGVPLDDAGPEVELPSEDEQIDGAPSPEEGAGGPPRLPRGWTGVWGRVTDAKTGEAIIEGTVRVTRGANKGVQTDVDGYYAIRLPPGSYDLRVFCELYQGRRLGSVVVGKGSATRLDVQLSAAEGAVQTVVIETKLDKRSTEALLQERKRSAVVSDALSAEEIARSPDTSASEAVKRVPSATVKDGRYVFIRGLGGRYAQTLLNRTDLPSPEPDEPSVPLDLFPAALLSNLNVIKTYAPDLPGNFSGGALILETNTYPSKLELKLKLSLDYNSEATFRKVIAQPRDNTAWLGFDDGSRQLPKAIPINAPVNGSVFDDAQRERLGEAFANVWSPKRRTGLPGLGLGLSVGGTRALRHAKLGFLAAFSYGYKDRLQAGQVARASAGADPRIVGVLERASYLRGVQSAQLGALANLGVKTGTHDVSLFSFYTHSGDNDAYAAAGVQDNQDYEATRLRFIERELSFTQLRGEHRFQRAHDLELSWQGNVAITTRREPDTRDVTYNLDTMLDPPSRRFRDEPQSGERFYSTLRELSGGGGLHVVVPWRRFKLRWGAAAQHWDRRFQARRFRFTVEGPAGDVNSLPPEQLFTPEHVGPIFQLNEVTRFTDSYAAHMTVGGGYVAGELNAPSALRILAGVRYEVGQQVLTPGSPFAPPDTSAGTVRRLDSDFMPALSAVYAVTKSMNLRAAYSYTLARPRFRELAPFFYYDFQRRRGVTGNPDLVTTHVHNADLRWEWFLDGGGVLAASVFYKSFDRPIEAVIRGVTDNALTYANARGAHLAGAEIEARGHFGFIHRRLRELYGAANVALIWSQIALDPEMAGDNASLDRPLQGQSPYVLNLTLGWHHERTGTELVALYNVYGARLAEVGPRSGDALQPDVYEQPFHRLDLTFAQRLHRQVRLKVAASNLAYQRWQLKQGDLAVLDYQPGVTASASVEWTPY